MIEREGQPSKTARGKKKISREWKPMTVLRLKPGWVLYSTLSLSCASKLQGMAIIPAFFVVNT